MNRRPGKVVYNSCFVTPTAREDPRINVCDFYLFSDLSASTVMAIAVDPRITIQLPTPSARKGFTLSGSISRAMRVRSLHSR